MATDYPEARAIMLEALLPNGADVQIALFDGSPIAGGVELTLTGYARVLFQDWVTTDLGGESQRANNSVILFPIITAAGTADSWAIYDTAGTTLLRGGALLDALDQPVTINIGIGDEVVMNPGQLRPKLKED